MVCIKRLAEIDNAGRDFRVSLSYDEELYDLRTLLKPVRSVTEKSMNAGLPKTSV
jgi:hypothetical protein